MATTLTNFIVGLGMDTSDYKRGEKEVLSGVGSMRSQILQLGAIAGGAYGFGALTTGFANATDSVGKFTQVFGGTVEDIRAFGQALEQEGGSLESLMGQIENLQRMRAMTPAQIGGLFAEAGIRGVDPSVILNAESATDAYLALADVLSGLTTKQRLPVADVFGLDEASIRLLSQGRDEVERLIDRQREIRPLTDEMTEAAAEYNRQWKELRNNIAGVADEVSMTLIPVMSDLFTFGNEFFNLWREGLTLGEIAGETGSGGRLSAESTFGAGAAILDRPISEVISDATSDNPLLRALIPAPLQASAEQLISPVTNYFSGDSGAMPTFSDPRTESIARDMLERQRSTTPNIRNDVNVVIEMDGQQFDARIKSVTEQQYSEALEDIESSNGG